MRCRRHFAPSGSAQRATSPVSSKHTPLRLACLDTTRWVRLTCLRRQSSRGRRLAGAYQALSTPYTLPACHPVPTAIGRLSWIPWSPRQCGVDHCLGKAICKLCTAGCVAATANGTMLEAILCCASQNVLFRVMVHVMDTSRTQCTKSAHLMLFGSMPFIARALREIWL